MYRELSCEDVCEQNTQQEDQLNIPPSEANENSFHTFDEGPPNPHTPEYEEIRELQAARTCHPQRRPQDEAADSATEFSFTQCSAYGTTHGH